MADATRDANGRVTMAVLGTQLGHLSDDFTDFREEIRAWRKESEQASQARRETCQRCIDELDRRVTRNEERLKQATGVLGAMQLVAAAVAAWIGVSR